MRRIKWQLAGGKKNPSPLYDAVIPEEVLPGQFWAEVVKVQIPEAPYADVAWGIQSRNGHEIGHGPIMSIHDGDVLQIEGSGKALRAPGKKISAAGKKCNIEYVLGNSMHTISVRENDIIQKLLNDIRKAHKATTIERIKTQSAELRMNQTAVLGRRVGPPCPTNPFPGMQPYEPLSRYLNHLAIGIPI
jgi:hypothetical protein